MKPMFKKAAACVLVFSSIAGAVTLITKDQVNKKMEAIVAPYNVDGSKMEFSFTDLNVSEIRALDFGMKFLVSAKGPKNDLVLKADNISYHFGNGSTPTVNADLSLKLNFLTAFGQEALNGAANDFEQIVTSTAQEYAQKYGAAATIDAKVLEILKDDANNVTSAKVRVAVKLDMSKLPEGMEIADVEFQSFQTELHINTAGIGGRLQLVMNPLHRAFQSEEPGLKEIIDALLNDDAKIYADFTEFAEILHNVANSIVNMEGQH